MQRRAAAAYAVLFLAISVGAYGVMAATSAPTATVEKAEASLHPGANETFTVDGQTYTVSKLQNTPETKSATLTWTNESARWTRQWKADATVEYEGEKYTVSIPNESDPSTVTLVAVDPGENARILNDSEGEGQYVAIDEDGDGDFDRTVPIEEYNFTTITFQEGEQIRNFPGENTTAVQNITKQRALLTWEYPKTHSFKLSQASEYTLNGKQYLVYFQTNSSEVYLVELSRADEAYYQEVDQRKAFKDRMRGFWYVTIVGVVSAIVLVGLAYLPRKDT